MRRLISLLVVMSLVAGPLATAGATVAGEHREGRGDQRGEQRGEQGQRGGQGNGRWGGGRTESAPQGNRGAGDYRGQGRSEQVEPRGEPRGEYRGEYRGDYRGDQRMDPRYDPRAYGPPPGAYSAAPRRGGFLGPGAGEIIQNPASQRLRPAPRGYEWVRTARGNALVSQSTGQVFDVVPY